MTNEYKRRFDIKNEEKLARKIDTIIDVLDGLDVYEKYFVLRNLYFVFLDTCQKEGIILNKRGEDENHI